MMRILLLGKNGQLGWELHRALQPLGDVTALDYPEIDFTHPNSLIPLVKAARPQVIINATAYTAVDRAESEPELAVEINGRTPGLLAELASSLGAAIIHYSTDYVFDGKKGAPYLESDIPAPLNVYGQSKLLGEQAVSQAADTYLILRTSWVYSLRRDSFVTKVLGWARQHDTLRIVSDQVSNPTWARLLAEISAQMLATARTPILDWARANRGIYHLAGSGMASRLEWAQAILQLDANPEEQITRSLQPALTSEFPSPATRPLFSALDCSNFEKSFGLRLPDWRTALSLAMQSQNS